MCANSEDLLLFSAYWKLKWESIQFLEAVKALAYHLKASQGRGETPSALGNRAAANIRASL